MVKVVAIFVAYASRNCCSKDGVKARFRPKVVPNAAWVMVSVVLGGSFSNSVLASILVICSFWLYSGIGCPKSPRSS